MLAYDENRVQIYLGDALAVLKNLPSNSVHACVTSPPYMGLRSYLPADHPQKFLEVGQECSPQAYVERLVVVFREVRRVLRNDGTLWLNMGDSFSSGGRGLSKHRLEKIGRGTAEAQALPRKSAPEGFRPKNLMMIPARLAIALQEDGWNLRADIIWHKPSCLPESVTDRPTTAHEHVFLFSKSLKYYYDAQAIAEPCAVGDRGSQFTSGKTLESKVSLATVGTGPRTQKMQTGKWSGEDPQSSGHRIIDSVKAARAQPPAHDAPFGETRNSRSVWSIVTEGNAFAHFASFPQELARRCIVAGCPEDGTVLDCFIGSGTTAVVARRWGRCCIGVELSPDYLRICRKRLAQHCLDLVSEE